MRKITLQILLALVAVGLLVPSFTLFPATASATRARQYSLTDLGTLGRGSVANSINDNTEVVGQTSVTIINPNGTIQDVNRGFFWTAGVMTEIGSLGRGDSNATSINASSQVAGWSRYPDADATGAVIWEAGVMRDLGTLGALYSFANDMNSAGQVVGTLGFSTFGHAFLWRNGTMTDLEIFNGANAQASAINDAGQIIGTFENPDSHVVHGFLWDNGIATDLGDWKPTDINNQGQIVGSNGTGGVLWQAGVMRQIGTNSGQPFAVNEQGQIVGAIDFPDNGITILHAAVYDPESDRWLDLNSMVTLPRGWYLDGARDINNSGEIVGLAIDVVGGQGTGHAFLLKPVGSTNCTFSLPSTSQTFNASGGSDAVRVTTSRDCTWTAVSNDSWITVTGFDGVGNGRVRYAVSPTNSSRTGTITVAGQTFTVTQTVPTVTIWLNAYIPRNLFWLTLPVPNSSSGETMIPSPLPPGVCFLTDQRSTNLSLDASSRMHSQTTINLTSMTRVDSHRTGPTIAVACLTGTGLGSLTADDSRMQFTNLIVSPDQKTAKFTLRGAASNPFITGSPDIRYEIRIEVNTNRGAVHVDAQGYCTVFPAFEMYAAMDGGPAQPLFQKEPGRFSSPLDLLRPDAIRPVSGRVVFRTQ